MGAEVNGELVSGVVFNNFNESNSTCHIAVSKPTKTVFRAVGSRFCVCVSSSVN